MALGRFQINSTLDTATDPDDTTLLAAPGANQVIYVQWLAIIVISGQANGLVNIEDGVGGDVIGHADATSSDQVVRMLRFASHPDDEGLALTANTALNATVEGATGVTARVVGECVVRGG